MTVTREMWDEVTANSNMTPEQIETGWATVQEQNALHAALEEMGLTVSYRKHLLRLSNVQTCWGGHLKDATCHYQWQVTVVGNTYNHRDTLKALGYRFEGHSKLWWRAMTKEGKSIADHLDIAKKELTQC